MSDCVLEELLLLSYRERAARRVTFHPRTTILLGNNTTGKSSIIKSIYATLGADPARWSDEWRRADVVSLLRFRIGARRWSVARHSATYSLFDADGTLVGTHTRVTKGLGPALAALFDFGLRLTDKSGQEVTPPPAYLFLPYYIDQDASWQHSWAGFALRQQFPRWLQPVAEYHTGLRPNAYYRLKAAADRARRRAAEASGKLGALRAAQEGVQVHVTPSLFQLDPELFRAELQELLIESRKLDVEERKYRMRLRDLQGQRTVLAEQRRVAMRALREAQKDLAFATALTGRTVECPTCGTAHENSFAHRFAIAEDEARCRELIVQLERDLRTIDDELESADVAFRAAVDRRERLRALLTERRGSLQLQDVIRAEGRAEVRRVFRAGMDTLTHEVRAAEVDLEEHEREMRKLGDAERRSSVRRLFHDRMRQHLETLDVALPATAYPDVWSRIEKTGSELPRALLAYFYAVLHTMREFSSSTFCPIVIDSPNQQAYDDINHGYVLRFLFEERPANAQLIVGLESARDVPSTALDDATVVELPPEPKRAVLQRERFEEVSAIVTPLLMDSFRLTMEE